MAACKRKDDPTIKQETLGPKKPRLVFTDIQRRTLMAIFKETKRPSKEMQATIAEQLGLKVSTVANFFMNARRRSLDKYQEEHSQHLSDMSDLMGDDEMVSGCEDDSEPGLQQQMPPMFHQHMLTTNGQSALTNLDTQQIVAVAPITVVSMPASSMMDTAAMLLNTAAAVAANVQMSSTDEHQLQ